jgi:two-component system nitrate/nitrite sensor histidine kinase NarX
VGLALEKHRVDDYARHIAVLEERDQLRAELHDSLAQSLVSIRLQLKILGETLFKKNFSAAQDQTRLLKQAADEAHSSLRQLLASFRVKMNHKGLVPALEEAVERFRTDAGIRTVFHHDTPELPLSPTQEVELFRIVQEALANIRRHAQARTVRVLLTHEDADRYRLLIEDDGVGIYPAAAHPESGHNLGLAIMRDRARRLHADLEIESEPGEGTRVTIVFHPGAGLRVAS